MHRLPRAWSRGVAWGQWVSSPAFRVTCRWIPTWIAFLSPPSLRAQRAWWWLNRAYPPAKEVLFLPHLLWMRRWYLSSVQRCTSHFLLGTHTFLCLSPRKRSAALTAVADGAGEGGVGVPLETALVSPPQPCWGWGRRILAPFLESPRGVALVFPPSSLRYVSQNDRSYLPGAG